MKKVTLLLVFTFLVLSFSYSQTCAPDGIVFYSQANIDDFQANYPGCNEIEGDVTIGYDGYLTDITNLNGLNMVTAIYGSLHINTNENLGDLSGLNALESIGGDFIVENNDGITNLSGLDALESIGGDLYVVENDNLTSFTGMESLTTISGLLEMGHNLTFSSFSGLSALTYVGGIEMNYVHQLQNMQGFSSLTQVDGDLYISSCNGLVDLSGFEGVETITGAVSINTVTSIGSLLGFDGLATVGGDLNILDLDNLSNISALDELAQVGGMLEIAGCATLETLTGLETLTSIGGKLKISGNSLITSLTGLDNIESQSITDLEIRYNPVLSVCEVQSVCEYLASPGGMVNISNNTTGCNSEEEVNGACGTGLDNIGSGIRFAVYPNPATDEVFIRVGDKYDIESIAIYDQMGKKIMVADPNCEAIDISWLSKGIYIVRILTTVGDARELVIKE